MAKGYRRVVVGPGYRRGYLDGEPQKDLDLFTRRFRTSKPRVLEENHLHIPLVSLLKLCIKDDVLWRHVPNGGYRDKQTAAKLKAMGTLAGSADLEFFWPGPRILFLELKLPGRPRSDAQIDFAVRAKAVGADYELATTIEQAITFIGKRGLIKSNVEVCGKRFP